MCNVFLYTENGCRLSLKGISIVRWAIRPNNDSYGAIVSKMTAQGIGTGEGSCMGLKTAPRDFSGRYAHARCVCSQYTIRYIIELAIKREILCRLVSPENSNLTDPSAETTNSSSASKSKVPAVAIE